LSPSLEIEERFDHTLLLLLTLVIDVSRTPAVVIEASFSSLAQLSSSVSDVGATACFPASSSPALSNATRLSSVATDFGSALEEELEEACPSPSPIPPSAGHDLGGMTTHDNSSSRAASVAMASIFLHSPVRLFQSNTFIHPIKEKKTTLSTAITNTSTASRVKLNAPSSLS